MDAPQAGPALSRSAAGRFNPWLVAVIVSLASFMEILDTTIANVALRNIAGSLGTSADESTYILTSYLVANAIIVPISGWLANVIGRKRFYMICIALFTLSSALCAMSTSLGMMIAFRALQGLGGGGLAPVEQSIFADSFPPSKRAIAFALYGVTIVCAPAIGPMLGGVLTDALSWHWVFLINLPVGLLSLILTGIFVSDSPQTREDRRRLLSDGFRVDYVGFVLIIVGFGSLQVLLDRFERDDGFSSPFISCCAALSLITLAALVVWELRHPRPLMDFRLLKIRSYALSNVVFFAFGFIIISSTQLTPQMTQQLLGYTATVAGQTLALGGIGTLLVMPLAGILIGRGIIQPKYVVFISLVGIAAGLRYATSLDLDSTSFDFSLVRTSIAIWLPFIFVALAGLQFIGVPPNKNNAASALTGSIRNIGGSCGIAFATTELAWRGQFHHARLAEHITATAGFHVGPALMGIERRIAVQASLLSYLDVFALLSTMVLVLSPLALFLPRAVKGAPAGH